jgi:glycosyltransferase involved in cell wall biosynthesis
MTPPADEMPLVTVVVPAYNAGRFLAEAIRSAQRQTYERVEILVVDDGSTDDTAEQVHALTAADPRVRLLRQENGGVAAARNRGIEAARGAFVAPLDADDLWYPEKLARQVQAMMAADETVGLVYTGWERLEEDGRPVPGSVRAPKGGGEMADRLVLGNVISCASVPLFRRACLDVVGGYDDHRRFRGQGCEDWDLYLRMAERYAFAVVPECLVGYRRSRGSMSTGCAGMSRSYDVMMARLVQRRDALPRHLLRRSRSGFYRYLSDVCRRSDDRSGALYWFARASLVQPGVLFSWASRWAALQQRRRASL